MKYLALFLLAVMVGIGSVFIVFHLSVKGKIISQLPKPTQPFVFSLDKAPSDSFVGTIASQSGEIFWQSRSATIPGELTTTVPIKQGEEFITHKNSFITLQFAQAETINISANADVKIIQTLPVSFVIEQTSGLVTYTKVGSIPFSLRSLDVLVKQNSGKMTVSVDTDTSTLTINVLEGSITAAYNDLNNVSTIVDVTSGKQLIFDNQTKDTRILTLP